MLGKDLRYSRLVWCQILIIISLLIKPVSPAAASAPQLTADAAILMDYRTGQVLYSNHATQQRPPASTTKILTALLGLELGSKKEIAAVSRNASRTGGASLSLREGDSFYLNDIIKGALISSGNDAAAAIAEHIGENKELFACLMNYKAKVIGASRSQFFNPHGLPCPGHHATAYDLALITRYALKNKDFQEIVKTRTGTIRELKTGSLILLSNTNRLLWSKYRDLQVIGVKTGTTSEAGQCLVAAAEHKGRTLISVVLHSHDRYADTLNLLNYGFRKCHWFKIAKGEPLLALPVWNGKFSAVGVGPDADFEFPVNPEQLPFLERRVRLEPFLKAPFKAGTKAGTLEIFLKERLLFKTDLVTLTAVPRQNWFKKGV